MTWTRKELKEKGKKTFKKNYWKCVLVAIILAVVTGSFSTGSAGSSWKKQFENHKDKEYSYKFEMGEDGFDGTYTFTDEDLDELADELDIEDESKDDFINSMKDATEDVDDEAMVVPWRRASSNLYNQRP